MKKGTLIALALSLVLVLCLGAAGLAEDTGTGAEAPALMGGWQAPKDGTPTEKTRELLDKAFNGIEGNAIEPIAVLGTQIVSGTNTCILCRITPAVQDAVSYYAMIYVYEDLEGKVLLNMIVELDPGAVYMDGDGMLPDEGTGYSEENG